MAGSANTNAHAHLQRKILIATGTRGLGIAFVAFAIGILSTLPTLAQVLPPVDYETSAEFWLEKPVLAINTCIYWWSLRQNGIGDKIDGFGSLLLEH
jgi:hypothetical protein